MASAKTLYWIALGVLAVSFGSSNMGRNLACKASTAVDHLAIRTMPYVAAVEMALGRTQAGNAHMQAYAARLQVEQARTQAAQARLQAKMVRQQLRQLRNDRMLVMDRRIMMPDVVVDGPNVSVNDHEHVIVCPRTRVRVAVPEVSRPQMNIVQDPI
jgi:predicted phosphoribosyltransferase